MLAEINDLLGERLEAVIADVTMAKDSTGKWFIRGKVNGVQQMGKPLTSKEIEDLKGGTPKELVFWNKVKREFPNLTYTNGVKR